MQVQHTYDAAVGDSEPLNQGIEVIWGNQHNQHAHVEPNANYTPPNVQESRDDAEVREFREKCKDALRSRGLVRVIPRTDHLETLIL